MGVFEAPSSAHPPAMSALGARGNRAWIQRFVRPRAALLVLAALSPLVIPAGYLPVLIYSAIWGIALIGLVVLTGYAGQIALGQGALFAVGAYASGILTVRYELSPLPALIGALIVTLLVALALSLVLRARGLYFALITLALALLLAEVVKNMTWLTGGNNGLPGVPTFGIASTAVTSDLGWAYLAFGVLLIAYILGSNLTASRAGRALLALSVDEDAARAMGIPVTRYKVGAWLFAAGCASIGGSLYAHYTRFLAPAQFGPLASMTLVLAVFVGGRYSFVGAVGALALLRAIPTLASLHDALTPNLLTGALLVISMIYLPNGVAPTMARLGKSLRTRIIAGPA